LRMYFVQLRIARWGGIVGGQSGRVGSGGSVGRSRSGRSGSVGRSVGRSVSRCGRSVGGPAGPASGRVGRSGRVGSVGRWVGRVGQAVLAGVGSLRIAAMQNAIGETEQPRRRRERTTRSTASRRGPSARPSVCATSRWSSCRGPASPPATPSPPTSPTSRNRRARRHARAGDARGGPRRWSSRRPPTALRDGIVRARDPPRLRPSPPAAPPPRPDAPTSKGPRPTARGTPRPKGRPGAPRHPRGKRSLIASPPAARLISSDDVRGPQPAAQVIRSSAWAITPSGSPSASWPWVSSGEMGRKAHPRAAGRQVRGRAGRVGRACPAQGRRAAAACRRRLEGVPSPLPRGKPSPREHHEHGARRERGSGRWPGGACEAPAMPGESVRMSWREKPKTAQPSTNWKSTTPTSSVPADAMRRLDAARMDPIPHARSRVGGWP
jgi:hypothetical protein